MRWIHRHRRDQGGAAALELALLFTGLCALVVLLAPLPYAILAKIQLERAAGKAARFATQTPDRGRPGVTLGVRRPTLAQVESEATKAYADTRTYLGFGTATAVATKNLAATDCARGIAVTVTMQTTLGLGPFAFLYDAAKLTSGPSSIALSASATNCQE